MGNPFFFAPNGSGSGSGGLTQATQSISNNVSNTSITALLYSSASQRGAFVDYLVDRGTDTAASKVQQIGRLLIRYDSQTSDWFISDSNLQGDAGVTFTITSGGQVRYTSSNLAGTNYFGNIYFYNEAIAL